MVGGEGHRSTKGNFKCLNEYTYYITDTFHILFFQKRTARRIWKAEFSCEKQRSFTYTFYKKCTESH